jgi:hypothetical protein
MSQAMRRIFRHFHATQQQQQQQQTHQQRSDHHHSTINAHQPLNVLEIEEDDRFSYLSVE